MKSRKSQEEINTAELAAWNEWKVVCSIRGCGEENRKSLTDRVEKAFERKLGSIGCWDYMPDDCAYEFDMGIVEKTNFARTTLNYKDHTWAKMAKSGDAALKVIRGGLTGRKGFINEIAESYLRSAYPTVWEQCIKKRDISSLDVKVEDDEGESRETRADRQKSSGPLPSDASGELAWKDFQTHFPARLSRKDAAILLVYLSEFAQRRKLSLATPELLAYTGFSKTKCYDRLNNALLPVLREAREMIKARGSVEILFLVLKDYVRAEKAAARLLLKLEEA